MLKYVNVLFVAHFCCSKWPKITSSCRFEVTSTVSSNIHVFLNILSSSFQASSNSYTDMDTFFSSLKINTASSDCFIHPFIFLTSRPCFADPTEKNKQPSTKQRLYLKKMKEDMPKQKHPYLGDNIVFPSTTESGF